MWKCDTNYLGKNMLNVMKQDQIKKYQAERVTIGKKAYLKLKDDLDVLIATRKTIEQFNLKELTTIIKCYKQNAAAERNDNVFKIISYTYFKKHSTLHLLVSIWQKDEFLPDFDFFIDSFLMIYFLELMQDFS